MAGYMRIKRNEADVTVTWSVWITLNLWIWSFSSILCRGRLCLCDSHLPPLENFSMFDEQRRRSPSQGVFSWGRPSQQRVQDASLDQQRPAETRFRVDILSTLNGLSQVVHAPSPIHTCPGSIFLPEHAHCRWPGTVWRRCACFALCWMPGWSLTPPSAALPSCRSARASECFAALRPTSCLKRRASNRSSISSTQYSIYTLHCLSRTAH